MIHAIVFANRKGYGLFEHTEGFPQDAARQIYDICTRLKASGTACAPGLRYLPLGQHYLLSVVIHFPLGNADESRTHLACVNFLMDPGDADLFFRIPFSIAASRAEELAHKLLEVRGEALPYLMCQQLVAPCEDTAPAHSGTPLAILMAGAAYCREQTPSRQLFLQVGRSPSAELQALLCSLPPQLRRELRFYTGCRSAAETHGIAICYCQPNMLDSIRLSDFSGGPNTEKYWYNAASHQDSRLDTRYTDLAERLLQIPSRVPLYSAICGGITDWDKYLELSLLMKSPEDPALADVLPVLSVETLARAIRCGQIPDAALAPIYRASKRNSPLRNAVISRQKTLQQDQADAAATKAPPARWRPTLLMLAALALVVLAISCLLSRNTKLLLGLLIVVLIPAAGFIRRGRKKPRTGK